MGQLDLLGIVASVAAVAFMAGDYLLTLHGSLLTKRLSRGVVAIAILVTMGIVLREWLPPAVLLWFAAVLLHRANSEASRDAAVATPIEDPATDESERPSSAA